MLDRIRNLFVEEREGAHTHDELHLAAAALLVEAARMGGSYDDAERTTIARLLRERFSLDDEALADLVAEAVVASERSVDHYGFARRVKDAFDHQERIEMIEMLWEVVYADGTVHDHAANLLRRVAGLLYVSDRESGEARKRVLDRTGAGS